MHAATLLLVTVAAVAAGAAAAAPPPLQLHWLDPETNEARCMDGSRYGYYFRPAASTADAAKWVIELQGGGWCYNEGSCYGRTLPSYLNGVFGSSLNWTSTFAPYFEDFVGWNRVFLRYCSGASFTGYRRESWDASGWPVPAHPGMRVPNGTVLYFRGARNLDDTVRALQHEHGMGSVEELVVTGGSAGGLATTLNVDRLGALVGARRVAGLSDAGFFKYQHNHSLDFYDESGNYSADMRHVFDMVNASGDLSDECQKAQRAAGPPLPPGPGGSEQPAPGPWRCIMAATAERYVRSPLFILQSRFDHFQLRSIAGLECMVRTPYHPPWGQPNCTAAEVDAIGAYGRDLLAELGHVHEAAVAGHGARRALYLSACIIHGQGAPNVWNTTRVRGVTPLQAWRAWYAGTAGAAAWVEDCGLPCNGNAAACAPFA